jgi:hypothetical protein
MFGRIFQPLVGQDVQSLPQHARFDRFYDWGVCADDSDRVEVAMKSVFAIGLLVLSAGCGPIAYNGPDAYHRFPQGEELLLTSTPDGGDGAATLSVGATGDARAALGCPGGATRGPLLIEIARGPERQDVFIDCRRAAAVALDRSALMHCAGVSTLRITDAQAQLSCSADGEATAQIVPGGKYGLYVVAMQTANGVSSFRLDWHPMSAGGAAEIGMSGGVAE